MGCDQIGKGDTQLGNVCRVLVEEGVAEGSLSSVAIVLNKAISKAIDEERGDYYSLSEPIRSFGRLPFSCDSVESGFQFSSIFKNKPACMLGAPITHRILQSLNKEDLKIPLIPNIDTPEGLAFLKKVASMKKTDLTPGGMYKFIESQPDVFGVYDEKFYTEEPDIMHVFREKKRNCYNTISIYVFLALFHKQNIKIYDQYDHWIEADGTIISNSHAIILFQGKYIDPAQGILDKKPDNLREISLAELVDSYYRFNRAFRSTLCQSEAQPQECQKRELSQSRIKNARVLYGLGYIESDYSLDRRKHLLGALGYFKSALQQYPNFYDASIALKLAQDSLRLEK